jgi:catechol 2,3-dioxygenase-like lactoylglutathione lyase family enzyme
MTIQRMDHVGVVVDDLEAATAFFVELGLELEGEVRRSLRVPLRRRGGGPADWTPTRSPRCWRQPAIPLPASGGRRA